MSKFNTGDTVRRIRSHNGDKGIGLQIGDTDIVTGTRDGLCTTRKFPGNGNCPSNLELVSSAPKVGDSIIVTDVPPYWWIKAGMVGEITSINAGTYAFNVRLGGNGTASLSAEHFTVVPKEYLRDMTAFDKARTAALRGNDPSWMIFDGIAKPAPMKQPKPAPKVNKQAPIKSIKVDPAAILALLTDYVKGTLGIDAQVTKIVSSFEKSFDLVLKAEA